MRTNRERARLSQGQGIVLHFEKVCREYEVNEVERDILLFLLMQATALDFRRTLQIYDRDDSSRNQGNGIRAGTLLGLISSGYREEIANRKFLSTQSPLVRHEIVVSWHDDFASMASFIDEQFYLTQGFVRYIIGDNCIYSPAR